MGSAGRAAATAAVAVAAALIVARAAVDTDTTHPRDPSRTYCPPTAGEHTERVEKTPLPQGVTERRVTVAGVSTVVLEAGPRDSTEAAVFVHGNPGSSRDWGDLLAATSRYGRAIAFDMPGFGHADKPPMRFDYTVDGAARFIDGLLGRLGVRRADLVLHDFGGPWGLQWAAEHPDRLGSIVLIDTGVLIGYLGHPAARIWATPGAGEAAMAAVTRQSFHASVQGPNPRPLPEEFVDRMYNDFDQGTRCAVLSYYRAVTDPTGLGLDQADVLSRSPHPALVIWGGSDPYVPVYLAQRQRDAFPRARIAVFRQAGHWPFVEAPARARNLIVPFLASALRRPRPAIPR